MRRTDRLHPRTRPKSLLMTCLLLAVLALSTAAPTAVRASGTDPSLGPVIPIGTGDWNDQSPDVAGRLVVWVSEMQEEPNADEVWAKNLEAGSSYPIRLGAPYVGCWESVVSTSLVVWRESNLTETGLASRIRACNIGSGVPWTVRSAETPHLVGLPSVSGDIVVWVDKEGGQGDVFGKNLATGARLEVCTASGDQSSPCVSGDVVVWADSRSGEYDIWGYDLGSRTRFPICQAGGAQVDPAISGDVVVWADRRSDGGDIYGYDLVSHTPLTISAGAGTQTAPDISGNLVVWADYGTGDGQGDIYGCNLLTSTRFPVATASKCQTAPAISDYAVVWIDYSRGFSNGDVYGATLGTDFAAWNLERMRQAIADRNLEGVTQAMAFAWENLPADVSEEQCEEGSWGCASINLERIEAANSSEDIRGLLTCWGFAQYGFLPMTEDEFQIERCMACIGRVNQIKLTAAIDAHDVKGIMDALVLAWSGIMFEDQAKGQVEQAKVELANLQVPGFLSVTAACPVRLLVTDPQGRRTGTLADGTTVNEIPGATYDFYDDVLEMVTVPDPVEGEYPASLRGTGADEYRLGIVRSDPEVGVLLNGRTGTITVDEIATLTVPYGLDDVSPPTPGDSNDGFWHQGGYAVNLNATDSGSGVSGGLACVEYSRDGGQTWREGVAVTFRTWKRGGGSGEHELLCRATDYAGNISEPLSTVVRIDARPPLTANDAPAVPQAGPVTVHLTAADSLFGVTACSGWKETRYSLDGGDWTQGTEVTVSGVGLHWVAYYSVDNAGNVEYVKWCSVSITGAAPGVRSLRAHSRR